MNEQPISLEPQIIQFNSKNKQLIKIINRTSETINNCFFCLFNTSKYEFNPDSFKLQPKEHKIVTVTLLNKVQDYKPKEFAYIKSKNFSRRITLICNDSVDDDKMRSPSSGIEDIYTLSSRDYRETQKAAYDRVIAQKQAYIKRLQRRLQQQQQSNRKDRSFTSDGKHKNTYTKDIQQLQDKLQESNRQKQQLLNQNAQLNKRIKELQSQLIGKASSQKLDKMDEIEQIIKRKDQTIFKLKQDLNCLQIQCQGLFFTISEKQEKIRKYQHKNNQVVNELIKSNQRKIEQLQAKIEEQRKRSERDSKSYKDKVKKLEQKLSQSQIQGNNFEELELQIEKKQKQVIKLQAKLEEEKKKRKQYEQQKKKSLKAHIQNQNLLSQNSLLKSKVQSLERSVEDLRQQTIIYKSKVQQQQPEKASRYLQVALESCKNQNDILKRSRRQMQQSLVEETKSRKIYETKTRELESQIRKLQDLIAQLKKQKEQYETKIRLSRDESHETIMKLRSQNIELIQKMGFGSKKDNSLQNELKQSRLKIEKSQQEIKKVKKQSEQEIRRIKIQSESTFQKLKQIEGEKLKMSRKIEKYKKQTAQELKEISQSTLQQLKKVKEERKKLLEKVAELEKQLNEQREKNQNQAQTHLRLESTQLQNPKNDCKTRYPASQSDRRTGIKNQRKQIQQTLFSSSRNQELQNIYSELGELREFKNYISLQMKKLKQIIGGKDQIFISDGNALFSFVNIFEAIRNKLNERNGDRIRINEAQKQISFLRGRIIQIQNYKDGRSNEIIDPNFSAIDSNKYEGDRRLLQMVRQQMRNQYKKLHDTLSISQQKFELLKKKIYEQYRSRIIGILNSKQRVDNVSKLAKLEAVLERFVQGLGNKSHKQAILSKQVRLKQEARKQAGVLKQKVGYLNQLLQSRKGYCSRDPVKIFGCSNEPQWHDNIRLQAKLLTFQAQNTRLIQQISFYQSQSKGFEEQIKLYLDELELKQGEITKLRKEVTEIQSANAKELQRRQQDIEDLQKRFVKAQEEGFDMEGKANKEKQLNLMRQQIQRKKDIIKNLKQKQKLLEQLIESNRSSESTNRNRNKKQTLEELRVQQSLRQFKQNNRELRSENMKLKEEVTLLREQISKKNALLKKSKNEGEQSRIRALKQDQHDVEKMKNEIRSLKDQVQIAKSDFEKLKKKKQKEILELESEVKRIKNQYLIQKRSLQSIIRALCDSIKRLYSDLDIMARKKGLSISKQVNFQQLLEHPGQIDSIKVYETFEQLLKAISK